MRDSLGDGQDEGNRREQKLDANVLTPKGFGFCNPQYRIKGHLVSSSILFYLLPDGRLLYRAEIA